MRSIPKLELCVVLISAPLVGLLGQSTRTFTDTTDRRTAAAVVHRLEIRYGSAARLEATFLERYTENGRLTRTEAGKAYFERRGKMRWEYEAPEKNVFLVDGKTAWFYVPEDHTVTRVPAKESSDWRTPLALLAGGVKLSRICNKIGYAPQRAPENSADVMLYCDLHGASKPNEGRDADRATGPVDEQDVAYLEVVESSGELVRVLVNDSGGVGIEFRFANWQFNPKLEDSFFHFQVPRGVAIVNGELGAAQKSASP